MGYYSTVNSKFSHALVKANVSVSRQTKQINWSITLFTLAFIDAAIVLAFEGYVFGKFEAHLNSDIDADQRAYTVAIPTYLALFVFAEVYQLFLCYDALRCENTIQCIGIALFNTAMLVYAGIQYDQLDRATRTLSSQLVGASEDNYVLDPSAWGDIQGFLIAIMAVIGVMGFLMCYVMFKLYGIFGWSIYQHIGADIRMKRRYLCYQIYITLLKFDFFFFVGFTIQFCVIVLARKDVEFGLTIAVIPLTLLVFALATVAVRQENEIGVAAVFFIFLSGMAYFLFKLVRMYQPSQSWKYIAARKSLTAFAVITLVLIVVTTVNLIICALNFNKGLKQSLADERHSWLWHRREHEMIQMSTPPTKRRFSLD
ncbi:uncharacterized protein V1516DRAFT_630578 [Lipomyces oligophaga]|uniref:uncharacterized protein n=1 Tax=Lipomyces oligophaga TaxID=45792 RepID=UPI0034CEAFD0